MKTFYEVNGRRFESKDEAMEYEERLEKARIEKEKLEKEKQNRLEQIKIKEKELKELHDKFEKDYGYIPENNPININPFWFSLDSLGNFRII